jgi:hydroxymethylglutaryl-CoA lyase
MALPKRIVIHELGPREGMQIEKNPVATSEKIRLVDLLSDCVFPEIEVTSFVSPKWVPQMADAEQVVAGFKRRPGTKYTCVYLNSQGMARAVGPPTSSTSKAACSVTASEVFSEEEHEPDDRRDVRRGRAPGRSTEADERAHRTRSA